MLRCKSGPNRPCNLHSIANALDTIATGLLSPALDKVTRPKLMVRPRRTTRAAQAPRRPTARLVLPRLGLVEEVEFDVIAKIAHGCAEPMG